MAFRAAAMRVGAGGAGAAVAGPAASHCYSRPSARPGQGQREEGWCIPRFEDSTVLFSDEEVDNTINIFLGLPEGAKPSPTVVTEVGASDDDSSVSSGANFHMEEADNMALAHNDMRNDFSRTLQGLLKNSEVQRACMNALRDDPAFSDMLARMPETGSLSGRPLEMTNLLPPAVQIVEVGDAAAEPGVASEDPFKDFLDGLADRAKGVGEQIKRQWDSVGNSIGKALIRFGLTIHNILGRPFQQGPQYPEQSEWVAGQPEQVEQSWFQNPDAVGKVVIKVACCIVALMVFRRVVRL